MLVYVALKDVAVYCARVYALMNIQQELGVLSLYALRMLISKYCMPAALSRVLHCCAINVLISSAVAIKAAFAGEVGEPIVSVGLLTRCSLSETMPLLDQKHF